MLMKFGWGADPTPDDMPYRVESYSIEGATDGGIELRGNIEPHQIEMRISIAPENATRGVSMWDHAINQFSDDEEHGKGKIAIYRGEGVGESVLEIRFEGAWIARIDQSCSAADDRTMLDIVIAAAILRMTSHDGAEVQFTNHRRYQLVYNE
jgi:hypothetical protein